MSGSNSALKKSDISSVIGNSLFGAGSSVAEAGNGRTLEGESEILAAVRKRFAASNAEKSEAQFPEAPPALVSSSGPPSLKALTQLIANSSEAYTAALFRVDLQDETVELVAAQTLSRDLIPGAKFSFGQGLVGWVAENRSRVAASPFELDSTTLMFYSKDQELKSFIALPIYGSDASLLGVLAVDSKKSYAFNQMAEKVICDCATVAGQFFELAAISQKVANQAPVERSQLDGILETLRSQKDEPALLAATSDLPESFIRRDALVVLSLAENGTGKGVFYSRAAETGENNRLLEIVCRHKKLISSERSVQAIKADELGRTFLSIPIRVMQKEAGALNLLSKPGESFSLNQINSLEAVATTVGRELERFRLASLFQRGMVHTKDPSGGDWKTFESRGNRALQNGPHALLRISVLRRELLESSFGIETLSRSFGYLFQLLEQLRGTDGLLFEVLGGDFLVLIPASERDRFVTRLAVLLGKAEVKDLPAQLLAQFTKNISIRYAASTTTLRTIEQLRKKILDESNEQALAECTSDFRPRPKKPVGKHADAENAPRRSADGEKDKDWNW